MALSLNDKRLKRTIIAKSNKELPKKTLTMPWEDHETSAANTTSDKFGAKTEPIRSQNRANSEPKVPLIGAKTEPIRSQNEAAVGDPTSEFGARIGAGSEPIRSQNRANSEPGSEPKFGLADLSRLQSRCLDFVYDSCRFSGSRVSEKIFSGDLATAVKSTPSAVKKALQRLEESGWVSRYQFKKGPGGWTRYLLPEPVYRDLTVSKIRAGSEPIRSQNRANSEPGSEPGSEPNPPSSSSYINTNFLTTTTAETRARIEDEWSPADLDYSMLTDIGFGKSQVLQLRSLGIPFDVVQRSLVHFDFELRHTSSGKTIHEPLALLMKRMRQNGCWPAPEEFEKRHAYFRTLFDEKDQQPQEDTSFGEASSDHTEAWK
ncbi:MAG: hypothetical protein FJ146_14585 [Deltaproteobacteria bacterium]|nr:hypothetical protein [Deltaproteobacteria bacterium]